MTYDDWCKYSKEIIAEAEEHNKWAEKAKNNLLRKIGPRIARLGKTGYMGCGFHYSMEQTFGKLINSLAISWQPCANWCQNVEKDRTNAITSQVIYDGLIEQIERSEKSVTYFKKLTT